MSIDLQTLIRAQGLPSWNYGVSLPTAVVTAAINASSEDIAVTGDVICSNTVTYINDHVIVNKPGLNITGNGSFVTTLELIDFGTISGLTRIKYFNVPANSIAKGLVQSIGRIDQIRMGTLIETGPMYGDGPFAYSAPALGCSGLRFVNILNNSGVRGACDGVTFDNFPGTTSGIPFQFSGRNNIIQNCVRSVDSQNCAVKIGPGMGADHRSSIGNKVLNNTWSKAEEETVGVDSPNSYKGHGLVEFTPTGNVLVLTSFQSKLPSMWEPDTISNPLEGNNSLNLHALVMSGAARGRYFEIIDQADNVIFLDTSKYGLSGVQIGDKVIIMQAWADSEFAYNTVILDAPSYADPGFGAHVAFSFWGGCLGNHIHHNHVQGDGRLSTAFADIGIIIQTAPPGWAEFNEYEELINTPVWPTNQFNYSPNARNVWENNTSVGCTEHIVAQTLYYNEYWTGNAEVDAIFTYNGEGVGKVQDTADAFMGIGIEVLNNSGTGKNAAQALLDVTWVNSGVAPSTVYDEIYLSARMEDQNPSQPPLGGESGTTFGSIDPGSPAAPTTTTIGPPSGTIALFANIPIVGRTLLVPGVTSLLPLSADAPTVNRVLLIPSVTSSLSIGVGVPGIAVVPVATHTLVGVTASLEMTPNAPTIQTQAAESNPIRAPGGDAVGVFSWDGSNHHPVTITFT